MGFDWMAFAEGFMETAATNIKEKKKEAREYETEQEDLAKRNLLKISQRNATVNKVLGVASMLKENGVTDDQLQAAIASGPNAIVELSTKVQEAVAANGGRPLSSSDVDSIIRMPKDFSAVDMDLDEYVKRSYGLYSPTVGAGEAEEVSIWDRVTGDAAMKRTRAKLDTDILYEGMTAADINELAAQSDYEAIIPSTFATFADFKRFDNDARMGVQADILTQIEALEEMDSEYAAARTILAEISPTTQLEEEQAQRNAALEVVQRKNRETFGPIFDQAITTYGTQAITGLEDLMTTYMGQEYVTELKDTLSPALREESETNVEPVISETGGKVTKSNNTITMSHPEVLVTEDGNALEVTFELDEAGTISSATVDGQTFEGEDAQLIYNEFEGFTPRDGITSGNSQWSPEDVPSEEDKPGGLMSPPEPEQPPTSVREKAIERLGVTEEDIQEGMDTGEITELDLQVLMEYGDDIYTYLEDKVGDDPDGMQLYRLMTDWAEENKKQLPFNMNFLVDTFRKALNNG